MNPTNPYDTIQQLREQVAAQAAVIEKLREALESTGINDGACGETQYFDDAKVEAALAIPTDSTQILDEVRRAEREKCAEVCESHPDPEYTAVHFDCARLIRAME